MVKWVPLLQAARGEWVNEIESPTKPPHLNVENAESLTDYLDSFYITSYRHRWEPIDKATKPPRPKCIPAMASAVTDFGSDGNGWGIKIRAQCGRVTPDVFIGFNLRPIMTATDLYTYLALILDVSDPDNKWVVRRMNGDQEIIDWRSQDLIEEGNYILVHPLDHESIFQAKLGTQIPTFLSTSVTRKGKGNQPSDYVCEGSDDGSGSSNSSRDWDFSKGELIARDPYCQFSGYDLDCWLFTGAPRKAHIIPNCRSDIVDKVRWGLDPHFWAGRDLAPHRMRIGANNHPANIIRTGSTLENAFDMFGLAVNPLKAFLQILMIADRPNRDRTPTPEAYHTRFGEFGLFPHPQRSLIDAPISSRVQHTLPPVSHVALLIHLRSALISTCVAIAPPETLRGLADVPLDDVSRRIIAWNVDQSVNEDLEIMDLEPAESSTLDFDFEDLAIEKTVDG